MKNRKLLLLAVGTVIAASLVLTGCFGSGSDTSTNAADEFGSLSSFTAKTLEGEKFTQDDIAKRDITVMNFWGVNCSLCIKEFPELGEFSNSLPDNVQVVTVCIDADEVGDVTTAKQYARGSKFYGPTLGSWDGDLKEVVDRIQYTPTTLIVNSDGELIGDAIIGTQDDLTGTLLDAVNSALKSEGKSEISLKE